MEYPSISMKLLDEENPGEEMKRFAQACHEWGYFQLTDHGVPTETIDSIIESFKTFFDLSQEVKEMTNVDKVAEKPVYDNKGVPFITKSESYYKKTAIPLFGVKNVHDDPPANMEPDGWVEQLVLHCRPVEQMIQTWPEKPDGLREIIDNYVTEMQRLGEKVLKYLSLNMGLKPNAFSDVYGGKDSAMIMVVNKLPPVPPGAAVLTGPSHRDNSGLTFLIVADGRQGFQVVKDGEWKSVAWKDKYTILVNFGDLMEIISNGRYKSVPHRGANLDNTVRFSLATGHNPNPFVNMGPVAELIDEEHPRLYGEGRHADLLEANKVNPIQSFEYFRSKK